MGCCGQHQKIKKKIFELLYKRYIPIFTQYLT